MKQRIHTIAGYVAATLVGLPLALAALYTAAWLLTAIWGIDLVALSRESGTAILAARVIATMAFFGVAVGIAWGLTSEPIYDDH